jgi:hypothetical protein
MTEEVKGLSYIPLIHKAYDALVASHRTSLGHALNLGKLLNDAKEAVGHGGWANWLKTHCPQISHRTANVYMNLAKNKNKFDESANSQRAANFATQGDMSIRAAIDAVNKADGGGLEADHDESEDDEEQEESDDKPEKPFDAMGRKADLAETLKMVAPDEVAIAINEEWEPEQREQLITAQLQKLPPTAIAKLLTTALDKSQLTEVFTLVTAFMKQPATPAPPPKSATATIARRELAAT